MIKARYAKWRRKRDAKILYKLAEKYNSQPIHDAYMLYIHRALGSTKKELA